MLLPVWYRYAGDIGVLIVFTLAALAGLRELRGGAS